MMRGISWAERLPAQRKLPVALMTFTLSLAACARHLPDGLLTSRDTVVESCRAGEAPAVKITYLGAGGFYLERGRDAILTAPFYSNPGFLRVLFGLRLRPEEVRIEAGLDAQLPGIDSADAILVGHSHYDHLMDLPYVAELRIRSGLIYGNETMANLLASTDLTDRIRIVNDLAGDDQSDGEWIAAGERARFMALTSAHAPHSLGIKLFRGRVTEPRDRLPRTGYG